MESKIEGQFVAVPSETVPPNVAEHRLTAPGAILELLNRDLRGQADEGDLLALRSDPNRWLNLLYNTLHSLDQQIKDRDLDIDRELSRDERSPSYATKVEDHRRWRKKVLHFRSIVFARIGEVRALIPDDDLRALLTEGAQLDPEDSLAVTKWQHRARQLVAS